MTADVLALMRSSDDCRNESVLIVAGKRALARASLRAIAYIQIQEVPMALITIKDLLQSVELDRQAMLAILGGARAGARPTDLVGATFRSGRIVDYPPGFVRDRPEEANGPRPVS
jgi:hypothetical protein